MGKRIGDIAYVIMIVALLIVVALLGYELLDVLNLGVDGS